MNLSHRLTTAFDYARTIHHDQLRKGTTIPYLSHPLAVCSLALGFGADEDEAIAALLTEGARNAAAQASPPRIPKRRFPTKRAAFTAKGPRI